MNIFISYLFIFFIFLTLLFTSCQQGIGKYGSPKHIALSNQAVFCRATLKSCQFWDSVGEKVYYDPHLVYRPGNIRDKYIGFGPDHYPELLYDRYPQTPIPLIIPDSLSGTYRYYDGTWDLEKDTSLCVWSSPLLPTKRKGVYVVQDYFIGYYLDHDEQQGPLKFRVGRRSYSLFKIRHNRVSFIEQLVHDKDVWP